MLPELAKGLGHGVRRFRKEMEDDGDAGEESDSEEKVSGAVYEALTTANTTAEFTYPRRFDPFEVLRREILEPIVLFIAQGFGIGKIRIAPGTFGSLAGLVWFF